MGDNMWRCALPGTRGHQVCLGTQGQWVLCGVDGRGKGRAGWRGWRAWMEGEGLGEEMWGEEKG